MTQIASEAGHWYYQDGKPCYELPNKSKPGEMRPTTKRDAERLNLSPSVSMVIKSAADGWGLQNYKFRQAAVAGRDTPQNPLEGEQAWLDRVAITAGEHAKAARELGTLIHGEIEKALTDTVWIPSPHASAAIKTLGEWCGLGGLYMERSFAHPLGYGGKCDVHKEGFVADFKSKDFTELDPPKTYENHAMQLAAYSEGFGMGSARCAIIYVSTSVPGLTHLVELDEDELERGWDMFCSLLKYWQLKNRYIPHTELTKTQEEIFVV